MAPLVRAVVLTWPGAIVGKWRNGRHDDIAGACPYLINNASELTAVTAEAAAAV